MSSISGLEYNIYNKNITGIYEITDGCGSTLINGVINCNSLFIGGVACLPGTTGTPGPQGPSGTIQVGTTTTLSSGTSAYVTDTGTLTNAIFNFGIPIGNTGATGPTGPTGPTGATGLSATATVGTTTTLQPGNNATVTNVGTLNNAIFNFAIPQGQQGNQGSKGDKGNTGSSGSDGTNGTNGTNGSNGDSTAATLSAGLAAGSAATAAAAAVASASSASAAAASAATAASGIAAINTALDATNVQVNQNRIDIGINSTDIINIKTQIAQIENTQVADQTAFTNQIATINGRLTAIETELTIINPANGFFNQF